MAKYERIFVRELYVFQLTQTVFRERRSRKTASFEEQYAGTDMRRKIKTIVFIILLIFYNAREKMFTNSLLHICCVGRFLQSVL